jgi:hypothetical protein
MHPINLMPMVKRFCAFSEPFVAIKHSIIMCDWSWIQNWKSRLPSPDQLGLNLASLTRAEVKSSWSFELWITHFKFSLQVHEHDGTKNIVLHWQFQRACVQPFALWDFDCHSCHLHFYLDVVTCRENRDISCTSKIANPFAEFKNAVIKVFQSIMWACFQAFSAKYFTNTFSSLWSHLFVIEFMRKIIECHSLTFKICTLKKSSQHHGIPKEAMDTDL